MTALPRSASLRALLVAFEFPPLANGGVFRALGLAETLPAMGIDIDVLTVSEGDAARWSHGVLDHALTAREPRTVYRVPSGIPSGYWRLTSSRLGFRAAQYAHLGDPVSLFWRRPVLGAVSRIMKDRPPDVLLATAPPFGVAVLAREIAHRFRLPWVVDWRDPWMLWRSAPFPTYGHYRYAKWQESRILREANISVATSHVTRDDWLGAHTGLDSTRLVTVYNGYDAHVLPDARAPRARQQVAGTGASTVRRIVYVGSFYYDQRANDAMLRPAWRRPPQQWLFYTPRREDWRYRSPYYFLRGLRRFVDRCPEAANRVRVEFAGVVPGWLPDMLDETGTRELVILHGPVSHARSLQLQLEADAVLLTSAKVLGGRDYSIAGKLFEYFGLRRPILAVVTDGAMRDLIDQSGLGLVADPDDPDAIATQIERVVRTQDDGLHMPVNDAYLQQFDRRSTLSVMATALRRAAGEGYRG